MHNLKPLAQLSMGLFIVLTLYRVAQADPAPENNLLEQAYNPLSTLEVSTTTEVSNMLVLLKYGRIEIHEAVFCKLDIPFNSTNSYHGMLIGDMTLTLDSLPPDSETQFNLFDAMNPGEDVVLHPKKLYFHVGEKSGFHVENNRLHQVV